MAREQRRLAAIVAADVVGYSRLMGRDESGTLARWREHRKQRLEPILVRHGGRLVKLTGDGALSEFPSAVDAVSAAIEFQQAVAEANRDTPEATAIVFRIGVHLGDLIVDGDDLYGDGVNIAARLEGEADAGGIVVSRTVHEAVAGRVAAGFDDLGALALKNIERPVQAFRVTWQPQAWQPASLPEAADKPAVVAQLSPAPLPLPDKPSIAVLPFQNMSGDPEQEYFVDGLVEDIITALSRFKSLFVIARNSSFTYKGKAVDIKLVGRELGVRYVLEGSVRKASGRVRITGQLIDASDGSHLWADRFDGALEDVFELQDRVTTSIVGAIAPKVEQVEIERARYRPANGVDAYDYLLRALAKLYQLTGKATDETLTLIDAALARDPDSATAHALKAFCYSWRFRNGWMADPARECADTERHARRAIELARDDAAVLAYCGLCLAAVNQKLDEAAVLIERALELNPNLALGWTASGWLQVYRGNSDLAIEHAQRALRLSPIDLNIQSIRNAIGHAHLLAGRFAEASAAARLALQAKTDFRPALRLAAVAEALSGNIGAARTYRERLQQIDPKASVGALVTLYSPYQPEHVALIQDGLRKAGLPD